MARFRSPYRIGGLVHAAHPTKGTRRIFNDGRFPDGRLVAKAVCGVSVWEPAATDDEVTCPPCKVWLSRPIRRRRPG